MRKTDLSVRFLDSKWVTLAVILFAPFLIVTDIFIVNVALATIKSFYHTTLSFVQLVIAAYLIGFTLFMITGSRAGDRFGRKKVYCFGVIGFTISSALCGWAGTIEWLVFFRFLQGVFAAFTMPQALTLMHLSFDKGKDRDKAYGIYGITQGVAAIAGQLLGGYFISSQLISESWRLIFLINIPVGIIATILAFICLKESTRNLLNKFDIAGVILLSLSLLGIIFPITRGRELGFPIWSIAMFVCGLAMFALFIRNQHKKTSAGAPVLINTNLFNHRKFNLGLLCVFFFFGEHNGFLLNCTMLFQDGYKFSAVSASYLFLSFGLGFIFASSWSIRNASKYGARMLQGGCLLMLLALLAQRFMFTELRPQVLVILATLLLYGLGNGLVLPSILNISLQGINHELAGTASGVYSTVQQLSSALGVSVIGGVFFSLLQHLKGYAAAFISSGTVMIIYLVMVTVLLEILVVRKPVNSGMVKKTTS